MKILFINACARPESRTLKLAECFMKVYKKKNPMDEIETLNLFDEDALAFLNNERLQLRNELAEKKEWNHPIFRYANQIANVDKIIVAAPYWDLAFPAILKVYLENAFVAGITFAYGEKGSYGKCKAEKLVYITTAGGPLNGTDLGGQYMDAVCKEFGIKEFQYLSAEGVDVQEWDTEKILREAMLETEKIAETW